MQESEERIISRQITREALYNLIWLQPMRTVALRFGISDVGLKKICRSHDIPVPQQGHWNRIAHGKKCETRPLPPPAWPGRNVIELPRAKFAIPAIKPEQEAALRVARQRPPVNVPRTEPGNLHSIASSTKVALKLSQRDDQGFIHTKNSGCVASSIGPGSIGRAARIIHGFACALDQRGIQFRPGDGGIQIVVEGLTYKWGLTEEKARVEHIPSKAELADQKRYNESCALYPHVFKQKLVYPSWDYVPSGRLVMAFESNLLSAYKYNLQTRKWRDTENARLEERLNEALEKLITNAVALKHHKIEEAHLERLAVLERERAQKERVRQARLRKRREYLLSKADEYAVLERLRKFEGILGEAAAGEATGPISVIYSELLELITDRARALGADGILREISDMKLFENEDLSLPNN